MRRHAKASSAHSTTRQAGGLGRIGTVCLAVLCLGAFLGSSAPAASAVDSCPNAKYRVGLAASLPDCRAYEKVTPADKNDADVSDANGPSLIGFQEAMASENGERALFSTASPGGDPEGAAVVTQFRAERTSGGWRSDPLTPPVNSGALSSVFWDLGFSRDLSLGLFSGPTKNQFDPALPFSLMDLGSHAITEVFPKVPENLFWVPGVADDLSHVLVQASQPLTPGSPPGLERYLYDYTGGQLEYVGILPNGATSPDSVQNVLRGKPVRYRNAMSANGERIFFLTPDEESGNAQLYVREGNATTKRVSAPEPDAPPHPFAPEQPSFQFASRDGRFVFFKSAQKLTADSTAYPCDHCLETGGDLYRYDVESGDLVDVTVDLTDPFGALVISVIDGSDDGSRVYFLALGKLTADAPPARGPGSARGYIYEWHDNGSANGELHYVATQGESNIHLPSEEPQYEASVSENGRYFGWFEDETIPTDSRHIKLYDAVTHTTTCLGCIPGVDTWASFSRGHSEGAGNHVNGTDGQSGFTRKPRNILDDGTVFFETNAAFVPQDTNGVFDVYEYKDGEYDLLSNGAGTSDDTYFSDATADGRDVFLTTREQLVGSDEDELTDLYDVREGGGFDEDLPHPVAPPCSGEGCRGASSSAPLRTGAGTASFEGPGNKSQPHTHCAKGRRKVIRGGKSRCVKRGNHKKRNAKHNRRAG